MKVPMLRSVPFFALAAFAASAQGAELIVNGGFETGTIAGWTEINQNGGSFSATSGNTTPLTGMATVGAASGTYYAVSDQGGPGVRGLIQNFTVGAGLTTTLSFDMFVNDSDGGPILGDGTLDSNGGPKQFASVQLLSGGAGDFDTGAGVLATFYIGVDPQNNNPNPYTSYSFDISSLVAAGGTYRLRFAEVDNQLFLNQGVDNVSVQAVSGVPGPAAAASFALMALRRRRKA